MSPQAGSTMTPEAAIAFGCDLLIAAGVPDAAARVVAEHLVQSDASGHASHGLGLLVMYVEDLRAGRVSPDSQGSWISEAGPVLVVDGERGFGAVVTTPAIARAASVAHEQGVALLAVRNVHHLGRLGAFAEQAAAAGLASIHFCNVVGREPVVVPAGGREARFVTNPIAVGLPRGSSFPIVLDMATSGIALNKVRVAYDEGRSVEPGYLIDAEGRPSTDPGVLFREPHGALLPFAQHKGSGLAVVGELLAGALTGGGTIAPLHERDGSTRNNMLSILIEPDHVAGSGWRAEAEAMIASLHDCVPVDPDRPVLVPGEPEAMARIAAERDGIVYGPGSWAKLSAMAADLGVPLSGQTEP